ncbi:MAG TPA: hypothetical protein VIK16_07665 [Candidatus Limnocylindrales bacterium]
MAITHRRSRAAPRLLALIGVAALFAACGGTPTPPPATTGTPSPSAASSAPSTQAPSASASRAASPTPSVRPDESPSPQGSETPLPTVSPSPRPGSADACSGTAENRDFYAALAASVAWDVYCAVLPPGWFVESGSYRLSNGGQLSITYRGPDGARLVVREGSYCAGLPDCIPSGTDAGSARFGERDARLLDLGNGSLLVVVASAGGDVDWQATGSGMDGSALAGYTAAFARVDQ